MNEHVMLKLSTPGFYPTQVFKRLDGSGIYAGRIERKSDDKLLNAYVHLTKEGVKSVEIHERKRIIIVNDYQIEPITERL